MMPAAELADSLMFLLNSAKQERSHRIAREAIHNLENRKLHLTPEARLAFAELLAFDHQFERAIQTLDSLSGSALHRLASQRAMSLYVNLGNLNKAQTLCPFFDYLEGLICKTWISGIRGNPHAMDTLIMLRDKSHFPTSSMERLNGMILDLAMQGKHTVDWTRQIHSADYKLALEYAIFLDNPLPADFLIRAEALFPFRAMVYRRTILEQEIVTPEHEFQIRLWEAQPEDNHFELALWYAFIQKSPMQACHYSKLNWNTQRYVSDALLLKQCAAQNTDAQKMLSTWQTDNNINSPLFPRR